MKLTLVAAMAVALCAALAGGAHAECPSDADVAALAAAMAARTPAADPPEDLSEADASCARAKLNKLLAARFGPVIGYKAGLTNAAVQRALQQRHAGVGCALSGMVLDTGATVDAAFGARPLYEADLLVRVRSDAINRAKSPADVMAAIDQIVPFIELPDLAVQSVFKLNGPGLTAINAGARLGVKGLAILVPQADFAQAYLVEALRDMTVRVTDSSTGAELARGKGTAILDQPLNAVVWLADALAKEGLAMRPGDLISLGSFSPLADAEARPVGAGHLRRLAGCAIGGCDLQVMRQKPPLTAKMAGVVERMARAGHPPLNAMTPKRPRPPTRRALASSKCRSRSSPGSRTSPSRRATAIRSLRAWWRLHMTCCPCSCTSTAAASPSATSAPTTRSAAC